MKRLALLCAMLLVMVSGTSAFATMSGTLYSNGYNPTLFGMDADTYTAADTSKGAVGINAIMGSIDWSVDQLESGMWQYTYTATPYVIKKRGYGSFNIEFGSVPTDLTWEYSYSGPAEDEGIKTATTDGLVKTIDKTGTNSWMDGEPVYYEPLDMMVTPPVDANVTTTFQGMEWIMDEDLADPEEGIFTLTLTTSLAPTWGNIYLDGYNMTSGNGYAFLRNTNYDIDPDTVGDFAYLAAGFDYASSAFVGWVATPGAVPVPASLLLFGSGLGGLFIFQRRSQGC